MNCDFEICDGPDAENRGRFVCRRCGMKTRIWLSLGTRIVRTCHSSKGNLGDAIAWLLNRSGITKERVVRVLMALKHWPEIPAVYLNYEAAACGCAGRQQMLNRVGWRAQDALNRFGWWLRHRWSFLRSLFR